MFFRTIGELYEISDLISSAANRKLEYYSKYTDKHYSIEQLESIILECIERARLFRTFPFIDTEVVGNDARYKAKLEPSVFCGFNEFGDYKITYNSDFTYYTGRYIGFIFSKPLSEAKIKWMQEKGISYKVYDKSIYDYPSFVKYQPCKHSLVEYILKMAVWFITLHEVSHILNGHLDYNEEMKRLSCKVDIDISRAMELHADMCATDMMLIIMRSWESHIGEIKLTGHAEGDRTNVTYFDELILAAISAYIALRCFLREDKWDEYTIGLHEGSGDKHPLTELRMAVVFNMFLQGLIDLGKDDLEKRVLANQFFNTVLDFEDFWFENYKEDDEEDNLQYRPTELLRTEKGKDYYHRLFEKVMELNDILPKYSCGFSMVEGTWCDYQTIPERMFWT